MAAKKRPAKRAASVARRRRKPSMNGVSALPVAVNTYAAKEQHHVNAVIARINRRLGKLRAYNLPDPSIVDSITQAYELLAEASKALASVEENWKPLRGSITTAPIETGSQVELREKHASKYDFIDASEGITVIGAAGHQYRCQVVIDGERTGIILPRTHVQPAKASA